MIKFVTNTEALGEALGAVFGISAGMDDDYYLDGLIREAHNLAAEEFDLAAAASASAGYLSHMFEYGVPGITRGPTRIPDATDPRARLWTNTIMGRGGKQDISVQFRPAMVPNPQPTTAYTGVPSKYLRKLSRRKYIFRQKAMVMETGMEVEIKPKNGNLLFVPFYGEQAENSALDKRGFMMYPFAPKNQPIMSTPGRKTRGQFTSFWNTWWSTNGEAVMSAHVERDINVDVQEALDAAAERATKHRMTTTNNMVSTAAKSSRQTQAAIKRKSAIRSKK